MRRLIGMAGGALVASTLVAMPSATAQQAGPTDSPAPPPDEQFQKVTLNDTPGEPMDLAVLPDGRVLHTTRPGEVWLHDPDTGLNTLAAELDVYQHDEEGLQSIALDPGFNGTTNTGVYLYYSPPMDTPVDDPATPDVNEGDAPLFGEPADFEPFEGVIRLSRFELDGDELDLSTEQQILDVPVDRGICCHVGGDIVFDSDGNLYLSTGDDTNPFESDGYAPIDERADRNPAFDAQRSSANTNDLRGKVLRIDPEPDGSYSIPEGNLFEPGTEGTRPEIYAMGLRNPFRIEIDPHDDTLYVADYSPDAGSADPERGPAGTGKWLSVEEPGNYGWPYCITSELPYVDYDFATETSGEPFDCSSPVNESPHNTGLTELPPVTPAEVWYSYDESSEFPELGSGGIGPMAGPAYDFDVRDTRGRAPVAWPEYYDGVPLFYEWTRDYVKAFHLDDDGDVASIEDVIPSIVTNHPMDMEFGPNGALYILEYGAGYFAENPGAQLARVDYIGPGGNHTPQPVAAADPSAGQAPLTVQFSSEGTTDAEGDRLIYEWDFDADGTVDSREQNPTHTYGENGLYRATLKVTDIGGRDRRKSASAEVEVVVGNDRPVVEFVTPTDGDSFSFGDTVEYEVQVTDDQPFDCEAVTVTYILGHNDHGHPQTTANGCTGTIETTEPSGHDPEVDDLHGVFDATYTDPGGDGLPPLTGRDRVVLEPAG
ncbi:PKD domain-containing protein [Haloactinopolyspora alba]|uniref:PKD domain-containing protein n=1 Tax=Haloactinopolyspora alba TaxID=648780 RepID=A0A2P8EC26_9ACTN|nr:PQQ-dependent sugar dehydrogenase [Haloactinopolyspora alba]PSL06987.1 PKD domain-containing protein [Haloactinopolyspora alba]